MKLFMKERFRNIFVTTDSFIFFSQFVSIYYKNSI